MKFKFKIVSITKKGQVTIPKELREKFGLNRKRKIIAIETEDGILIKPLLTPEQEKGSLRNILKEDYAKLHAQELEVEQKKEKKRELSIDH